MCHCPFSLQTYLLVLTCPSDWLTDCLTDWLTDWLSDIFAAILRFLSTLQEGVDLFHARFAMLLLLLLLSCGFFATHIHTWADCLLIKRGQSAVYISGREKLKQILKCMHAGNCSSKIFTHRCSWGGYQYMIKHIFQQVWSIAYPFNFPTFVEVARVLSPSLRDYTFR